MKLVDYFDSKDSENDDIFPPHPSKRSMVIYSGKKEEDDYQQYYTIKPVRKRESRQLEPELMCTMWMSTNYQKMCYHYKLYLG